MEINLFMEGLDEHRDFYFELFNKLWKWVLVIISWGLDMTHQPLLNVNIYNCKICWYLNIVLQYWAVHNFLYFCKMLLNQSKQYLFIIIWCWLITYMPSLRNYSNNELGRGVAKQWDKTLNLLPIVFMELKLWLI